MTLWHKKQEIAVKQSRLLVEGRCRYPHPLFAEPDITYQRKLSLGPSSLSACFTTNPTLGKTVKAKENQYPTVQLGSLPSAYYGYLSIEVAFSKSNLPPGHDCPKQTPTCASHQI